MSTAQPAAPHTAEASIATTSRAPVHAHEQRIADHHHTHAFPHQPYVDPNIAYTNFGRAIPGVDAALCIEHLDRGPFKLMVYLLWVVVVACIAVSAVLGGLTWAVCNRLVGRCCYSVRIAVHDACVCQLMYTMCLSVDVHNA